MKTSAGVDADGIICTGVGGIVLCGGRSSRMGRAKVWLPIAGEPMLLRVVRVLSEVVAPIVVVAAAGQAVPPLPALVQLVCDDEPEQGPLQGLATGLAALAGRVEAAYVSSCDVPFLQSAFVRRLLEQRGAHAACVPYVDGRLHPLAAVVRIEVLGEARRLLDAKQRRLGDLLQAVDTRVLTADVWADIDPQLESLRNINTPDDYQRALASASGM